MRSRSFYLVFRFFVFFNVAGIKKVICFSLFSDLLGYFQFTSSCSSYSYD
jgi:hypothetical protein